MLVHGQSANRAASASLTLCMALPREVTSLIAVHTAKSRMIGCDYTFARRMDMSCALAL
jgi:hypothetical protein